MGFIEKPSDLGGGLSCLRGVARFSGVLPAAEVCSQAGLALDVDIDGPLGDESPERGKIEPSRDWSAAWSSSRVKAGSEAGAI